MDSPRFTARVAYTYDDRSSSGKLIETGTRVLIHPIEGLESSKFAVEVEHKNYLPAFFVDSESTRVVQRFVGVPLRGYVQYLQSKGIMPITLYEPHPALQPDSVDIMYDYVPVDYRRLVKGLLAFILYIHEKNRSLVRGAELPSEEYFVVSKGELKFWRVGFRVCDHQTKLADFRFIYSVIKYLFRGYQVTQIPNDMIDLIRIVHEATGTGSLREGHLTLHHMALLSHSERVDRIRTLSDIRCRLHKRRRWEYDQAVKNTVAICDGWTNTFSSQAQFVPMIRCFQEAFRGTQKSASEHYKDQHKDVYLRNRFYLICCRNLATHLPEHFMKRDADIENVVANDIDLDCMLMRFCGDTLVGFQGSLGVRVVMAIASGCRGL